MIPRWSRSVVSAGQLQRRADGRHGGRCRLPDWNVASRRRLGSHELNEAAANFIRFPRAPPALAGPRVCRKAFRLVTQAKDCRSSSPGRRLGTAAAQKTPFDNR